MLEHKPMKAIYFTIAASVVALGIFISIALDGAQKTVPKIKLSYFADEKEIAVAILKRLQQEMRSNPFVWIGVEPEKSDHIAVAVAIKEEIEKQNGKFDEIIIDSELRLTSKDLQNLQATQSVLIKENIIQVGNVLKSLEQQNKKYYLVTAAVYSNSFIKKNQIHHLKENYNIKPLTISFGYFAASPKEEKNILFPCDTEDKSGVSNWGCALVNKARVVRRKFDQSNIKPWSGLMDLTGEKDYMLLLRKQ